MSDNEDDIGTPAWDQERTRAVPWTNPTHQWFFLTETDEQQGPFALFALREQVKAGRVQKDTYVWKHGMADWEPIGELPELSLLWESLEEPRTRSDMTPLESPPQAEPSVLVTSEVAPAPPILEAPVPVLEPWSSPLLAPKDLGSFLFADISNGREPITDVSFPDQMAPLRAKRVENSRIFKADRPPAADETTAPDHPRRSHPRRSSLWMWWAAGGFAAMLCVVLLFLRRH